MIALHHGLLKGQLIRHLKWFIVSYFKVVEVIFLVAIAGLLWVVDRIAGEEVLEGDEAVTILVHCEKGFS